MTDAEIRSALKAHGFDVAAYGYKTAVMAFQSRAGLVVDGLAGPKTQAALKGAALAPTASPLLAPTALDLSPIGRAALVAREGERLTAYLDTVGVWTIGVGITTASGLIVVKRGLTITKAESDALFSKAVVKYVDPVRKALVKPVPQQFFDACCSLAFNIGPVGFANSTIVRRANAGDLPGAVEAFLMWNKPAGIISRRQGERDQAATPYAIAMPKARRGDARPVQLAA